MVDACCVGQPARLRMENGPESMPRVSVHSTATEMTSLQLGIATYMIAGSCGKCQQHFGMDAHTSKRLTCAIHPRAAIAGDKLGRLAVKLENQDNAAAICACPAAVLKPRRTDCHVASLRSGSTADNDPATISI